MEIMSEQAWMAKPIAFNEIYLLIPANTTLLLMGLAVPGVNYAKHTWRVSFFTFFTSPHFSRPNCATDGPFSPNGWCFFNSFSARPLYGRYSHESCKCSNKHLRSFLQLDSSKPQLRLKEPSDGGLGECNCHVQKVFTPL